MHVKAIIFRRLNAVDCKIYVDGKLQWFKLPYRLGSSAFLPEMTDLSNKTEAIAYLRTKAVKNDVKKACAKYLGMVPDEYEIIEG